MTLKNTRFIVLAMAIVTMLFVSTTNVQAKKSVFSFPRFTKMANNPALNEILVDALRYPNTDSKYRTIVHLENSRITYNGIKNWMKGLNRGMYPDQYAEDIFASPNCVGAIRGFLTERLTPVLEQAYRLKDARDPETGYKYVNRSSTKRSVPFSKDDLDYGPDGYRMVYKYPEKPKPVNLPEGERVTKNRRYPYEYTIYMSARYVEGYKFNGRSIEGQVIPEGGVDYPIRNMGNNVRRMFKTPPILLTVYMDIESVSSNYESGYNINSEPLVMYILIPGPKEAFYKYSGSRLKKEVANKAVLLSINPIPILKGGRY